MKYSDLTITKLVKWLKVIDWILVVITLGYAMLSWAKLPHEVAVHFDIMGNPDRYGSKIELLILPLLQVFIFAMTSIMLHHPASWNIPGRINERNRQKIYQCMFVSLHVLMFIVNSFFSYMIITTFSSIHIQGWVFLVCLLLCSAPVVYSTYKIYRWNKEQED